MKHCVITFRSVMPAQRGEDALARAGIRCHLTRTPRVLESLGCGYCIWLPREQVTAAVTLLRAQQIAYGKVYRLEDTGQWEQVQP